VIDTASTRQLPLWPSVGALLISGWIGGIASSMLWAPFLGARGATSILAPHGAFAAAWLVPAAAGALVAAAILPRVLSSLCGYELGFGSAFLVTLGGSLFGRAAGMSLTAMLVRHRAAAAVPASTAFFVVPEIVSLAVGYQLLKWLAYPAPGTARDAGPVLAWTQPEQSSEATPAGEWGTLLAHVRAEVASTLTALARAESGDVPGEVGDALPRLEALGDRVEDARPPTPAAHRAQLELVTGIRRLQGALVDLAESAWRGDHRRELSNLRGLDEIERALADLPSVDEG
jgi:hypothetical protein